MGAGRFPFAASAGEVMEKAQRNGQFAWIRSLKAGATDHHVHPVMLNVSPDSMPQKLHCAPVAIRLEDTGAPEFEKLQAWMRTDQGPDVVLTRRVEASMPIGDFLAQETVRSHDLGF